MLILSDFGRSLLEDEVKPKTDKKVSSTNPQDELNLGQKVLTDPNIQSMIDAFTGGMSLPEAEQNKQIQLERLKQIPEQLSAPVNIKKPEDIIPAAGEFLSGLATPFVPAYQGIVGGLQKAIDTQDIGETIKGTVKGAVAPQTVPQFTGPERMPLTEAERSGGTEALIPRAVLNAVEMVGLGHLFMGGGIKDIVSEHKFAKQKQVIDEIGNQLPDIKDIIRKNNPQISEEAIANLTPENIIQLAGTEPAIGDYVGRVSAKVSPFSRIGLSTEDVTPPQITPELINELTIKKARELSKQNLDLERSQRVLRNAGITPEQLIAEAIPAMPQVMPQAPQQAQEQPPQSEIPEDLLKKGVMEEAKDHPEIAQNNPEVLPAEIDKGKKSEEKNLLAMHNLSAEKLLHAERMGGLAVPSLSIGKVEHPLEGFGDITLLGNKELINPKKQSNKVFNADIYSPRYPSVKYDFDSKGLSEARKSIIKEEKDLGRQLGSDLDSGSFQHKGKKALYDSPILKLKFLRSIGKDVEIPKKSARDEYLKLNPAIEKFVDTYTPPSDLYKNKEFLTEYEALRKAVIQDAKNRSIMGGFSKEEAEKDGEMYGEGWYEEGLPNYNVLKQLQDEAHSRKESGFPDYYAADRAISDAVRDIEPQFTAWVDNNYGSIIGKERLYNGEDKNYNARYLPHTLENVVRVMKRALQSGEGFNYGLGNVRASVAKRYKSIKEIQADRSKVLSKEEFEKVKEFTDNEFDDIIKEAYEKYEHKDRGGIGDTFTSVLIDGIKRGNIGKELKEYGFGTMDVGRIKSFLGVIKNMPTEYFEAKLQRAVGLNEFSGAIVPHGTSDKAIRALERNNIPYVKYDPNVEGDRNRATKELSEKKMLLFEPKKEYLQGQEKHGILSEEEVAYGKDNEEKAIQEIQRFLARGSASSLREQRTPNQAARAFLEGKRGSYEGIEVKSSQDAAEIFSVLRNPYVEVFQALIIKDGKIISHRPLSSGHSSSVSISEEQIESIAKECELSKADTLYIAHNHPSGIMKATREDFDLTSIISEKIQVFSGHVVTDGDKFLLIDKNLSVAEEQYKTSKEDLRRTRGQELVLNSAGKVALVFNQAKKNGKILMISVDAGLKILSVDYIDEGNKRKISQVNKILTREKAPRYFLVFDGQVTMSALPSGVVDVVSIGKDKIRSMSGSKGYERLDGLYEMDEKIKIAKEIKEPESEYSIGDDKSWEEPTSQPKENIEHSVQDKAEAELEIISDTGGLHPLEKFMESYKIKAHRDGKEVEEYTSVPNRFKNKNSGLYADELAQIAFENGLINEPFEDVFLEELRGLGDRKKYFTLSPEVKIFLKDKANLERIATTLPEKLSKLLGKEITPQQLKRAIDWNVGLKSKQTPYHTSKEKMHKLILAAEQRAGKRGEVVGREQLREKARERRQAQAQAREARQRFTPEQRKELYQKAWAKGLIIEKADNKHVDKLAAILSHYKDASFDEVKNYIAQLQGSQDNPAPKILKLYGDINKDAEAMKLINDLSGDWQDINKIETGTLDPVRRSEKVTGLDAWDSDNILVHNIDGVISGADMERFSRMNSELKELHENMGGVLAETKVSADLMQKSEEGKPLTAEEQKKVDYLRKKYDMLLDEANAIRAKLNQPLIPKRKDYMTHIGEKNLLTAFFKGNIRDEQSITTSQLDAIRKGDFTKGNMKFNQFAQKRIGKKTKYDAIGNYEKYLETMLYEIYMSPAVAHARKFSEYALLRLPNMYKATTALLDRMAGKPSAYDRTGFSQAIFGNSTVKWIRSQIAKNALIGNINFNLVNLANITTNIGELGIYSAKGLKAFLSNTDMRRLAFEKSSVLQSRKNQFDADVKAISVFDVESLNKLSPIEKAKVAGKQFRYLVEGLTRIIEYNNVGSTWCGAYMKGVDIFKFSPEKAAKYADTIARRTQTGYRSYEIPEIMASDIGKTLLQFQTWTFNAMNYLIYDLKLGNIPKQATKPFSKDNKPSDVHYKKFFLLLAAMMLVNDLYRRMGWREPTSATSVLPRVSFPAGRLFKAAGDLGRATARSLDINNFLGQDISRPRPETVKKAAQTLGTVALPFGGTQIARWLQGSTLPDNSKRTERDIVSMYEQAIRKSNKELFKKAEELAIKQNILTEEAQSKALKRIKDEMFELYSDFKINGNNVAIKKLTEISDKANFDEGVQNDLMDDFDKRLENKKEKTINRLNALQEQGSKIELTPEIKRLLEIE